MSNTTEVERLDISILYVEDDVFIRKMLVNILTKVVKEIHTAENGFEGLNLYKQINPDVVLTDIRMPVMNGLDMAEQIKFLNKNAPIIVTTAYGDTENLLRAIEIGIDSYVLKPINKNKLISVINRYATEILLSKKLKEQELMTESFQALLTAAIEQSPTGILVVEAPLGNVKIANNAALDIRGITNLNLLNIPLTEHPKNWAFCYANGNFYEYYNLPHALSIMSGSTIKDVEMAIKRDSGELRWITANSSPVMDSNNNIVASILIMQDITDRKKLTDQLYQAQKMEAVGQLTGGIAHDFNNFLTAIIGYGSLLKINLSNDDPNRIFVDQILNSAEKASTLTRNLLAFSRKQIIEPKHIDINEIIYGMQKILTRFIGENIDFVFEKYESEIPVFVDVGQIEQVIMNLVTNARDSINKYGFLKISTTISPIKEKDFETTDNQEKALITITDNGCGIEEEHLKRIFEPFFTTKDKSKGTGLGLSIVYGIIKQHNGHIFVSSTVGKGTEFRIYLPLSNIKYPLKNSGEESISHSSYRGTETILLAEDSPEVREITKEILNNNGYTVIEAYDGVDAINKFVENMEIIDFLLLDVIMPRKNGRETYEEIKKFKPSIKVLYVSGYATDILSKKNILEEKINFVSKPIIPNKLLKKIREILNNK